MSTGCPQFVPGAPCVLSQRAKASMNDSAPFPITTLQIPNPFFEGRNGVYVIHSDPLTVIDTGVATEKSQRELRGQLQANGLAIQDIGRIVLTHKHIDHVGNAWWLQEESGADILIHELETSSISDVDPQGQRWRDLIMERFDFWNVPAEIKPDPSAAGAFAWDIRPATPTAITGGQTIDLNGTGLEVIHTPGHTRGSVCLKLGRVLFSGDHVLPDISPNIGGGDLKHQGLLTSFLSSMKLCQVLASEVDTVLPGHGQPFENLYERCQSLTDHHEKRLAQIMDILSQRGPLNAYSVAIEMFGPLADMHVVLGCAEAQAHLEYLIDEGRVTSGDGLYSVS